MPSTMEKRRLILEYLAVREHFGDQARLCTDERREKLWWECSLLVGDQDRIVRVVYSEDHPKSPPQVVLASILPPGTPHVMFGRVLDVCHAYGFWDDRCTAATAMLEAVKWFEGYDAWSRTGRWPVPDALSVLSGSASGAEGQAALPCSRRPDT